MRTILGKVVAFLNCSKKTLLVVMTVAVISVIASSSIAVMLSSNGNLTVPSLGSIKTIGVETYWDQYRVNKAELVDWDEIWAGSSKM